MSFPMTARAPITLGTMTEALMNRDAQMDIKFPHLLQDRDRHGNPRLYYRRHGLGQIRLRSAPGSPAFAAEYAAAAATLEARAAAPKESAGKAQPGSLRWLCVEYFRSSAFARELGPSTRHARKLILDRLCASQGHKPYRLMEPHHVLRQRDRFEAGDPENGLKGGPEAGNVLVKALRQVFEWAIPRKLAERNPAKDVPYLSGNPEGWHAWTVEEIRQYEARHPAGSKARLALALLMYTGVRRSDVIRLGRQMVRTGWLRFTEVKGARRKPKLREIPVLPELEVVIAAGPTGDLTFLVTEFGRPFTHGGFGNWFKRRCLEAGLPHCSAHGLRKAAATIAAENGATEWQLMSIFAWETSKEAARYTRKVNRRRLAGEGMHLLAERPENTKLVAPSEVLVAPALKVI